MVIAQLTYIRLTSFWKHTNCLKICNLIPKTSKNFSSKTFLFLIFHYCYSHFWIFFPCERRKRKVFRGMRLDFRWKRISFISQKQTWAEVVWIDETFERKLVFLLMCGALNIWDHFCRVVFKKNCRALHFQRKYSERGGRW